MFQSAIPGLSGIPDDARDRAERRRLMALALSGDLNRLLNPADPGGFQTASLPGFDGQGVPGVAPAALGEEIARLMGNDVNAVQRQDPFGAAGGPGLAGYGHANHMGPVQVSDDCDWQDRMRGRCGPRQEEREREGALDECDRLNTPQARNKCRMRMNRRSGERSGPDKLRDRLNEVGRPPRPSRETEAQRRTPRCINANSRAYRNRRPPGYRYSGKNAFGQAVVGAYEAAKDASRAFAGVWKLEYRYLCVVRKERGRARGGRVEYRYFFERPRLVDISHLADGDLIKSGRAVAYVLGPRPGGTNTSIPTIRSKRFDIYAPFNDGNVLCKLR